MSGRLDAQDGRPRVRPARRDGRPRERVHRHRPASPPGSLLGLAIYFNLAGPLGRGVETLVGWFTGLGRFVVPIALIGIGAALIHKDRSEQPLPARPRLRRGRRCRSSACSTSSTGPRRSGRLRSRSARPAAGSARSSASRCGRCSPSPGAIVVFIALILLGVLVITGWSMKTFMSATRARGRSDAHARSARPPAARARRSAVSRR